MKIKKQYSTGDTVWIYGIGNNSKSTQGTVVKSFKIDYAGISDEVQYVICIPTEIENLLEIRTWHTISQTEHGHVGSVREAFIDADAARKILSRTGMSFTSEDEQEFTGDGHDGMGSVPEEFDRHFEHMADEDEISAEMIHAAMEKSRDALQHTPLVIKDPKPARRRNYSRKKKNGSGNNT
jgi:hypothetical protein